MKTKNRTEPKLDNSDQDFYAIMRNILLDRMKKKECSDNDAVKMSEEIRNITNELRING